MNICGIVCEYNPFHNGHLHHITETKKRGIDAIVCIMSGNFVQRADFAVMHKHARAESAIHAGADVVLELPVPWAVASAERFAHGAVSILDSLGVVSHISFGCENDNLSDLQEIASLLLRDDFSDTVLKKYSDGVSFAKARELATREFNPKLSPLLSYPNNILAIEYLKALLKLNSRIVPIAISRSGANHDEEEICGNMASASAIRELMAKSKDISKLVPPCSEEIILREISSGHAPVFSDDADKAILSCLKKLSASDYINFDDVSEGLEYRLESAVSKSASLSDAIARAKTKRYAHSRIRRIFLNAFLGIEKNSSAGVVPYARILAFNETGRRIIRMAKKSSSIPIITRPSSVKSESTEAIELLSLEKRCDDIYSLFMKSPISQGSTYTTSPIFVKNE